MNKLPCSVLTRTYASTLKPRLIMPVTIAPGPPPSRQHPSTTTPQNQTSSFSTTQQYELNRNYIANTNQQHETSYILTLLTDAHTHTSMTGLRNQYFPPKLNKLAAHLTLFHALPGSKLHSHILPQLDSLTSSKAASSTYHASPIEATGPFRMNHGIGISVSERSGQSKAIYQDLVAAWKPFLSKQDLGDGHGGGLKLHFTIMNKADSEEHVRASFDEVKRNFKPVHGMVEGLVLYRYDHGFWRQEQVFRFQHESHAETK